MAAAQTSATANRSSASARRDATRVGRSLTEHRVENEVGLGTEEAPERARCRSADRWGARASPPPRPRRPRRHGPRPAAASRGFRSRARAAPGDGPRHAAPHRGIQVGREPAQDRDSLGMSGCRRHRRHPGPLGRPDQVERLEKIGDVEDRRREACVRSSGADFPGAFPRSWAIAWSCSVVPATLKAACTTSLRSRPASSPSTCERRSSRSSDRATASNSAAMPDRARDRRRGPGRVRTAPS